MSDSIIEEILSTYEEKSLSELQSSIAKIESEIHSTVSLHHSDLLAQTANVELLENVVSKTLFSARSSLSRVHSVVENIENLHRKLSISVQTQENYYKLREKVEIVNKVLSYEEMIDEEKNLANVALYVYHIGNLCDEGNLDILKPYKEKASSLSHNIEKQTENMMMQGLNDKSFNQVASALQIFTNLGILPSKISKILSDSLKNIERDVKSTLNFKFLSDFNAKTPSTPGQALKNSISSHAQNAIWTAIETLFSKLVSNGNKIKFLAHVTKGWRDGTSNLTFEEILRVEENVFNKFWTRLVEILHENLGNVQKTEVKNLFEDEFPKLLTLLNGLGKQIEDCEGLSISISVSSSLRCTTMSYEKMFLSKSLSKLFDAVNHLFAKCSPSSPPTLPSLDPILTLIKNETSGVGDSLLRKLLWRNVGKMVTLVSVRSEGMICTDGSSTQVIGSATEGQIANSKIFNFLHYFKSKLEDESVGEGINGLLTSILAPIFNAISQTVDAILLTLHQENFKRTSKTTEYSLYMGELSSFLSRVAKDYLSLYNSNQVLIDNCHQLAMRTIKSLITNITLLPNLNSETKKQLGVDLNYVEISLVPICPVISPSGLRVLRAFRNLIQLAGEEISNSPLVGLHLVPFSSAILILMHETNGEIRGPDLVKNWSIARCLTFFEEKSEREKLELLKSTIESYASRVKSKGQTNYHSHYPFINNMLKKAFNDLQNET